MDRMASSSVHLVAMSLVRFETEEDGGALVIIVVVVLLSLLRTAIGYPEG